MTVTDYAEKLKSLLFHIFYFCNCEEFRVATMGNLLCYFVQFHYATNNNKVLLCIQI